MHTVTELFPNAIITSAVHEYSISHSLPLEEPLHEHRKKTIEWAEKNGGNADMMINTLQAQFMLWFIKALGAKEVLEIGCFTGYSALAFAQALQDVPGAEITTLDLPGAHLDLAQTAITSLSKSLKKSGKVPIHIIPGNATESLETLASKNKQYDIIFLDANKDGYLGYFKQILNHGLLSPRGILVADNALKMGLVADRSENNPASKGGRIVEKGMNGVQEHDDSFGGSTGGGKEFVDHIKQAEWLDEFNKAVKEDGRVENVVLPVFDGLNFIRLKDGKTNRSL